MDFEKLRIARDKLTRVFRYLEERTNTAIPRKRQIHEQPEPVVHGLPSHSTIKRGSGKIQYLKIQARNSARER